MNHPKYAGADGVLPTEITNLERLPINRILIGVPIITQIVESLVVVELALGIKPKQRSRQFIRLPR